MRSFSAILRLVRWENALIAAIGVLVGAWWVGGKPFSAPVLLIAAAAIALAAVANSYNDVCDIDIDRLAHPDRPLPSGALSPTDAKTVTVVSIGLALGLAAAASVSIALASVVVILLMIVYSRRLKRAGLVGNLTVAVLASLPFLYGAWIAGRPLAALPLLVLAVPLHLAREIAKDMEDARGDAGVRRTIPLALGPRAARNALFASLGAFLGVLVAFARTRPVFAIAIIPAVLLAVIAARRAAEGKRAAPLMFKYAMLCAMASLLVVREQ